MKSFTAYIFTGIIFTTFISCSVNNNNDDTKFGIFEIQDDLTTVVMDGEINRNTLDNFNDMISMYPDINLIEIVEVPGSSDDDVNLEVSLKVHNLGINTHLTNNGEISSGGVDFFLAGKTRTIGNNPFVGVHSWAGEDENGNEITATDFPVGHREHLFYINYYVTIGFTQEEAEDFYYFTIHAAHHNDIHWMTEQEIIEYKIITK